MKIEASWNRYQASLLLTRYNTLLFLIPALVLFSFTFIDNAMAATQTNQEIIMVQYANDTTTAYTVLVHSNQTHTISQRYAWAEDALSRYSLQAYSIDNGPVVPINRAHDGNFTLDVLTDSNHVVLFIAKPQFAISIPSIDNATFFPPSPTGDNWFDSGSDVQFIVPYVIPYVIPSEKQDTRYQLDGWSLDDSYINAISRLESGAFHSPTIHMSSGHTVYLEYKTQYYVKVISNFGRALGTGWYNSGTIVNLSVIPGNDFITTHLFSGWQGSTIGNQNQMSVETLADSPKVLVANWSVDYTNVSIISIMLIAVLVLLAIYQKRKKHSRT
ncbi:MAG: hypothetical protein ACYC6W_02195 [Nitrosotalea sp.]